MMQQEPAIGAPPDLNPEYGPVFSRLRKVWRTIPTPFRHGLWKIVGPGVQTAYAHAWLARPAPSVPASKGAPLVVAGLFSTANGIGEAARSTYRALEAAGLSPVAVDLSGKLAPVDLDSGIPCQPMPKDKEGILILQQNGPEVRAALQHLGMYRGRRWFTVGYWAWELPVFPKGWQHTFPFLSELWTISNFTRRALVRHPRSPDVHVFPHAVTPPDHIARDRTQFGWKEHEFVFLMMVDSMSSFERKNPQAAIRAFRSAFGNDPSRRLVVKTRNLYRDKMAAGNLAAWVADAPNIEVMDASLPEQKRWELLNAADAVVSLHRAEGFGFVIAEAMRLGKPVITTDWSGHMDFTSADTAFLVPSRLVACEDVYGVYKDGGAQWAEPDLEIAAEQMRAVVTDVAAREARVTAALTNITHYADLERIGQAMAARLSADG